jgi:NADH-quinone oxidoreductase subunit L
VYLFRPDIAGRAARALRPIHATLVNKYWFDETYQALFARGGLRLGRGLWRGGDVALIDGIAVNGSANLMVRIAALVRRLQSGYLFHYAFAMIVGLIALLTGLWWFVARTVH